jgi:hypothetical protein
MAVAGYSDQEESVLRVVSAFEDLGQSLQKHEPIRFSKHVARESEALTQLIRGDIKALRLSTAHQEAIIYGLFDTKKLKMNKARGVLAGQGGNISQISNFTMFSLLMNWHACIAHLKTSNRKKLALLVYFRVVN